MTIRRKDGVLCYKSPPIHDSLHEKGRQILILSHMTRKIILFRLSKREILFLSQKHLLFPYYTKSS